MGHLWRRGNKKKGVFYMGYQDRSGRWRQRSCRTRGREAAEGKLKEAEKRAACGEEKPLADFLQEYLKGRTSDLGAGGLQRYQFCVDILTDRHSPLARVTLQELDRAACTRYIQWRLGHGRSKATVGKEVAWLKAAIDEAAEQGHIAWERAYQLRVKRWHQLKKEPRGGTVLRPDQWEAAYQAANANLRDAMTVALWTGLRQGNILRLTEGHVDFNTIPATIRFSGAEMKNRHGLVVRLPSRVRAVLWERFYGNPEDPARRFFQDFRPCWKRLKKKLDGTLTGVRFHDLRGSYVSYRIGAGIDPKTVQAEVGHKTSKMTMDVYAEALRDPAVIKWGREHFRFPWDTVTHVQDGMQEIGVQATQDNDGERLRA